MNFQEQFKIVKSMTRSEPCSNCWKWHWDILVTRFHFLFMRVRDLIREKRSTTWFNLKHLVLYNIKNIKGSTSLGALKFFNGQNHRGTNVLDNIWPAQCALNLLLIQNKSSYHWQILAKIFKNFSWYFNKLFARIDSKILSQNLVLYRRLGYPSEK